MILYGLKLSMIQSFVNFEAPTEILSLKIGYVTIYVYTRSNAYVVRVAYPRHFYPIISYKTILIYIYIY